MPSPLKKEIGLLIKSKKIISNNNLLIPRFQIHDFRFMISFRLRRQKNQRGKNDNRQTGVKRNFYDPLGENDSRHRSFGNGKRR